METEQPLRQSLQIVAFDFDGTLTIRDSYTTFLRSEVGASGYAIGMVPLAPEILAYTWRRDRGRLKAAATRQFLGGRRAEDVERAAERFAAAVWDQFMRPDALACWEDWGRRGAERVIVTASPALTVRPFARRLGADRLIGTELETKDDRLTGAFLTPNCRAEEKVARLREVYGPSIRLAAAYGDTSGDTAMLGLADHKGWREFTGRP